MSSKPKKPGDHGHDHGHDHDHDHKHDHDHGHDHSHAHEHGHEHGHSHAHDDERDPAKLISKAAAATPAVAEPAPEIEDAATQALSEALSSSFKIVRLLLGILVLVFALSGMFTVEPNEVAVKLRFGRPVGLAAEQLLKPGWHWAFPYPMEEVVKIPVGQSHSISTTNGWYATTAEMEAKNERPPAQYSLAPGVDGYAITGDGNLIHVRVLLKYRIQDPIAYAFRFVHATNLLQHVIDNSMVSTAARFTAEAALYHDKTRFQEKLLERLKMSVDDYQLGISVEACDVQTIAPLEVLTKFEEVLTAQQEGDTKIREAQGYARSAANRAAGDAAVIRNNGLNASNQLVQAVSAESKYFSDQLPYYQSNPGLFRQRWLIETRGIVYTNAQEKHFLPVRADGRSRELRLLLSREPQKPVAPQQP